MLCWHRAGPLLLFLLAASVSAEKADWSAVTSRVTWSERDEWVKIEGAVLHHQQVFARMPDDVRLAPIRRLLNMKAISHVPVRYSNKKTPILCDRVENDPAFFIAPFMMGHYGHTMFDGVTGAYAAIIETQMAMGNLTFYMDFQFGSPARDEIITSTDAEGRMDLGPLWGEVFGVFSTRPIYNLPNLLEQSSDQVICFDQLVMGSSNTIEHYRAGAPFFNWTMFRQMGDLLLQHLPTGKLGEELDSECKYRVTVLDRQGTRQILNAQELADALKQVLHDEGVEHSCVLLAPTEHMTIGEQLYLMRQTRILIGVDGTGLLNSGFMPSCGGCVHIKPYLQTITDPGKEMEFMFFCKNVPGQWRSWSNDDVSRVVWPQEENKWLSVPDSYVELAKKADNASLAEIEKIHDKYIISRHPKMYVNASEVAAMARDIIKQTKNGCS